MLRKIKKFVKPENLETIYKSVIQEKVRGQRGTLPVHALGYVHSTKVSYRLALERKGVFRDIRIKANLDLIWLVSAV